MLRSVRDVIVRAKEAYVLDDRHVWVQEWPGQVMCRIVFSQTNFIIYL